MFGQRELELEKRGPTEVRGEEAVKRRRRRNFTNRCR